MAQRPDVRPLWCISGADSCTTVARHVRSFRGCLKSRPRVQIILRDGNYLQHRQALRYRSDRCSLGADRADVAGSSARWPTTHNQHPRCVKRNLLSTKRVFEKSRFCHISPTMFPHSSFQTAGANPGPRTVSLDLPGLFKHPLSSAVSSTFKPNLSRLILAR